MEFETEDTVSRPSVPAKLEAALSKQCEEVPFLLPVHKARSSKERLDEPKSSSLPRQCHRMCFG